MWRGVCPGTHAAPPLDKQNGWTALITASLEGHVESVNVLLAAGANKEAKDKVSAWVWWEVSRGERCHVRFPMLLSPPLRIHRMATRP